MQGYLSKVLIGRKCIKELRFYQIYDYLEDYETVMGFEEESQLGYETEDESDIEIVFENVSFTYPGMETEVLKDINLKIKPGEKIAIVGENGSGKSTFVSLLTGLYSPTKGRILINGKDISEKLGYLRKYLSCTMQDYLQHQDTIAENVHIGDLKHEHDKTDIRRALEKAGVDNYIDTLAESRLYSEFAELTKDKTVILISHRLGATRLADRVLVFHDGEIVEDGNHNQLLKNNGMYTEMYNAQAQWYTDENLEM